MKVRIYEKNKTIITEGTESEDIYFISSGKVRVTKMINNEEFELGILEAGTFFGEMSMFLGHKRTATVKTMEETLLLMGDKNAFIEMISKEPNRAVDVIATLANRLHHAHLIIAEIEGQLKAFTMLLKPFDQTETAIKKKPLPPMRPLGDYKPLKK
jgi:CRP-like cAMP-binding protein